MKAIFELPDTHCQALEELLKRVPPLEIPWVLVGSGGLRLQGVDVPVHDLDIESDEGHISLIEQRLADCMRVPVQMWDNAPLRSLDGKADLAGVQIELLADLSRRNPDGSWSAISDLSCRIWLEWHDRQVPVFPLPLEALAYEAMGRTGKAVLIRKTIQQLSQGGDLHA